MNAERTITRRVVIAGALLTPFVLAGCGGQAASAGPPEIAYGRDTCARCGMIISDERFAAALTSESGEAILFDDVGEMLQTVAEESLGARLAWANDRNEKGWFDATKGVYVRGDAKTTPMGTGVVAFNTRDGAEAFAAEFGGTVLSWNDAVAVSA
jgi:copper chaperone NosL